MGAGERKGFVYRWIPNHLQDAHTRIVPRSLLNLMKFAADHALKNGPAAGHKRLLAPAELQAALEETSRRRVQELAEEHAVVRRLGQLSGLIVMADPDDVEERLSRPVAGSQDGFGRRGSDVRDELVRLGVLRIRTDGRVDVPDIYRYGYGIKRKGGVARPR